MNDTFSPSEKLYRAVHETFWIDDRLSSACFKDKKGLSVNRSFENRDNEAIRQLENSFSTKPLKAIVSIRVHQCTDLLLKTKYLPEINNEFHSEIHQSESIISLSTGQAKKLAKSCVFEKYYLN